MTANTKMQNSKVSFADDGHHEMFLIEERTELNDKERRTRWFSKQDLAQLAAQDRVDYKKFARGAAVPDFDPRGLEYSTTDSDSKTTRLGVVYSVLETQRQLSDYIDDGTCPIRDRAAKLAEVCKELTRDSRKTAKRRAQADAKCVPEIAERMAHEKAMERAKRLEKKQRSANAIMGAKVISRSKSPVVSSQSRMTSTIMSFFGRDRRGTATVQ